MRSFRRQRLQQRAEKPVEIGQGSGRDQFGGLAKGKACVSKLLGQVAALYQFGNDVAAPVRGSADIVNRHDARMIEASDQARLRQVGLGLCLAKKPILPRNLDRHGPVKLVIVGQIDPPKAALAQGD